MAYELRIDAISTDFIGEYCQISPPLSAARDASFFRGGSGENLSELVMEFPAVLRVFLSYPRKTAFWGVFPLCPQCPPPQRCKCLFLLSSRRLCGPEKSLFVLAAFFPLGAKKSTQTFLDKVFGKRFGSWTSALETMDVHAQK